MQQFSNSLFRQFPDSVSGNAAIGVSVSVYERGTTNLVTLYADDDVGGATLPNPLTTNNIGFYSFYAHDGKYTLHFGSSQFPDLNIEMLDGEDFSQDYEAFKDSVLGKISGIEQVENLAYPAISDASGVELLGFNDDGSAVFKVSQNILNQLDPYFASQLEINGVVQSVYSPAPGIFTSDFIELLGFKGDGSAVFKVSQEVANQVAALIEFAPYNPIVSGLLPKTDITCWGDSMTQGAGGGGVTITTVLASELSRVVNNRGIGGQDALATAIRQGGSDLLVTLSGNQIPASGGVAITAKNSNILSSGSSFTGTVAVTVAGVAGTISTDSGGNWTFTRSASGSAVSVPANSIAAITGGTAHIPDPEPRRADTSVLWVGRNGVVGLGRSAVTLCRDSVINMVYHMTPLSKRVLVVSVCNGRRLKVSDSSSYEGSGTSRYNDVIAVNRELAEHCGDSFVDLRWYMVNHAIYDAGLTPTATDLLDMAADCIPTTLLTDDVHFTATGYEMAGKFLARQIKSRGW